MEFTQSAQERPPEQGRTGTWRMALLLTALGIVLLVLSRYSFLAFHVIAELASVTVAAALFMVAWHARRFQSESHLLFLATAYLAAACIDLVHTLTYSGMNIIPGYDSNLPTQLWLAARYLQALSLVAFPLVINRPLRVDRIVVAYAAITVVLVGLPMAGVFPTAFVEGQGLTPFKIVSEYVISGLLVVAGVLLYQRRDRLDETMFRYLMAALVAAVGSELSFALYVSVYDTVNLVGHLLKIASFVLVYRAIVVSGLERPFEVLFSGLHRSQEDLARERDNLTSILDAMQDSVYIVSRDHWILYTNPAMRRQFGAPDGRVCFQYMHDADVPCADCHFDRILAGETQQRLWTSPQTGRTYDVLDTPIRYGDGEIAKLKIMRDVTELKSVSDRLRDANEQLEERVQARTVELMAANRALRDEVEERVRAERALRISEERFRVALKSGAIIVAHVDRDLRYTWMYNPHPGFVSEEWIGKRDDEILPPAEARALMDLKREVLESGVGARREVNLRLADGPRIYDIVAEPLIDGEGQGAGVTTAALDITEQRNAQDALVQAEKLTLAGKLAASFAHEIKNPLQAVIGCLGLARELTANGEDATRYFDVAADELQRANRLVSQMRDMHQAPTSVSADDAEMVPADVNALVDRVLTLSDKEARNRGVVVERALAEDLPPVSLVPGHLEQVTLNLVLNALDAMPDGGTLTVRTGWEHANGDGAEGAVVIEVRDTGVGMSPEVAAHVFEDFYSTKPTGLGLGLFICRRIVEGYGGRIELESAEGQGACFTVHLPAERAAEGKTAA